MVIKLVLKPENELVLPINYNYYVQSMIYRLLQDVPQYSSFLHDCGYHMGALKFRLFTFGPITGHYRVLDKIIKFDGRIELEIRSVSEEFIFILRNALRSRESLWLKGQSVRMINVSMYKKADIATQDRNKDSFTYSGSEETGKWIYKILFTCRQRVYR